MLHVELKVLEGRQAGKTIPLNVRQFLIGREQDCHLRPNTDLVSRHHCVFTIDEFAVRLRDLGSTNGTFVNGERLQGQVVLKPGDRVSVGKLAFEILMQEQVAAALPEAAPEPAVGGDFGAADEASMTMEFPAVAPADDTTVFASVETATGMPVALPPGFAPQMPYQGMQYGMPQPGYAMPGYPQGYGMPGYPAPGYPPQYPPQYAMPGYAPQPGYMPGYGMPQMMPGYSVPGPSVDTAANASEQTEASGSRLTIEAPPMVLPDPETTGAKAPPPPPPPPPGEAGAPAKKPSDAAADIIRNQRLRRS
ncbi:MAG: FHA domain-containing protein [Planctomycetota bacterium]|nr:FHA domain-containing protein [Planctomycetota bacterium]